MVSTVDQYWHLFRWLMIPARYHYWLFLITVAVTVLAVFSALLGSGLNIGGWRLLAIGIWAVVFSLWSFSTVLVLHGQLVSLPSNRHLRFIPRVRQRALAIHWVVLTVMTIFFTAAQYFLKEIKFTLDSIILNWSLFSLASVAFLLCLKWLSSYSLLGVWLLGMGFSAFVWPLAISPWLLFALALIVWFGFSCWWLRWLPAGKVENIFLMRGGQILQNTSVYPWARLPINMLAPRIKTRYTSASLYLHLLNGVTGNLASRVIIWLLIGGFAVAGLGLISLLGYGGAMSDIAQVAIPITLWTFLSSAGMGYFMGLFANVGRVWFYFPGTRAELFSAVGKNFFSSLLIDLFFICVLIGLACYWVFPEYLLIKWVLLYVLLVLAVNWGMFHFVWYLYCRSQGNTNLLGVSIFLILLVQIFLAGFSWGLVSSGRVGAELLVSSAILCCFPVALLLRAYAKKATPKMCFPRVKN